MPLSRHIEQGRLLYFTQNPNAISVEENEHFRWLTFDDVIQSVMNKHTPCRLTLPHQYALLQPLRYIVPSHITEFGLGGGNIARFIASINTTTQQSMPCQSISHQSVDHQVVEQSAEVIHCYQQYFSDDTADIKIHPYEATEWLCQQDRSSFIGNHWFIYDIYQHQDDQLPATNEALFLLLSKTTDQHTLTVNFPFISDFEFKVTLDIIKKACPKHQLLCYQVPHYNNKIIHLLPADAKLLSVKACLLSGRQLRYWQGYHQRFSLTG